MKTFPWEISLSLQWMVNSALLWFLMCIYLRTDILNHSTMAPFEAYSLSIMLLDWVEGSIKTVWSPLNWLPQNDRIESELLFELPRLKSFYIIENAISFYQRTYGTPTFKTLVGLDKTSWFKIWRDIDKEIRTQYPRPTMQLKLCGT